MGSRWRILLVGAALAVFAATAQAQETPLQKLVAAAKAEGAEISLAADLFADVYRPAQAGIKKKYGIDVAINWRGGSLNEIASRSIEELKAGRPASVDLLVGEVTTIGQVIAPEGASSIMAVDWAGIDPSFPKVAIERSGQAVKLATRIPAFAYNTNYIKNPPKAIEDLFNPKWKGSIAMTPFAAGWTMDAAMSDHPETITAAFRRLLEEHFVGGFITCGPGLSRIASGEFWGLVLNCDDGPVNVFHAQGAPLANSYIEGLSNINYLYLAIPKNSPHPNTAKLFIIYMLSPEGQANMRAGRGQDLGLIPGNGHFKIVHDLQAEGIHLPEITVDVLFKRYAKLREFEDMYRGLISGKRH
jgi:ABC-type Fe3+ transport system substrate-binding protein